MNRPPQPSPLCKTPDLRLNSQPSPARYALRLDKQTGEIAAASAWLASLCARYGLHEQDTFRLDLCLNEALQNIVQHSTATWMEVELAIGAGQATLTFSDDGEPFDPLAAPSPIAPTSLDTTAVGGWGIHLLRRFSDRQHYAFRGGLNSLEIEFDLITG